MKSDNLMEVQYKLISLYERELVTEETHNVILSEVFNNSVRYFTVPDCEDPVLGEFLRARISKSGIEYTFLEVP